LNEEIVRRIKDSRLAVIDGVGHMVYVDEPEKTCAAILEWVGYLRNRAPSE
jgi:pimeloyl-ACP methyl ester carboxylesterase